MNVYRLTRPWTLTLKQYSFIGTKTKRSDVLRFSRFNFFLGDLIQPLCTYRTRFNYWWLIIYYWWLISIISFLNSVKAIGLIEKLAQVFCNESAPFQHLDTCIRFPSLAPILAPMFTPQSDQADFVQMYSLVIDRLKKGIIFIMIIRNNHVYSGHTTLAFSLLSKFQVHQFAAHCNEDELGEMIFCIGIKGSTELYLINFQGIWLFWLREN